MKKFGLPQCPYCGKKINPLYAWYLRTQGEYICPRCGGVSNIVLERLAYSLAALTALAGFLIFLLTRMFSEGGELGNILWIMLPFVLFSIVSAFMVRLKKPVLKKKEPPRPPAGRSAQEAAVRRRVQGASLDRTTVRK